MAVQYQTNAPFDARTTTSQFLTSLMGPFPTAGTAPGVSPNKVLNRGYIRQKNAVNNIKQQCNFLYNPSIIYVTHSSQSDVVANPDALDPNNITASDNYLMPLSSTLSFDLLFDRTYDMWDPTISGGNGAFTNGVYEDVMALYRMVGIASPTATKGSGTGSTATVSSDTSFAAGTFVNGAVGPMRWEPVTVYFGTVLSYYCVMTEIDIQYTHFTQSMTPFRCQVSISANILPTSSSSTTTTAKAKGTANNGINTTIIPPIAPPVGTVPGTGIGGR